MSKKYLVNNNLWRKRKIIDEDKFKYEKKDMRTCTKSVGKHNVLESGGT